MNNFNPEFIDLKSVNLPNIPDSDIVFWNVEGYPVIDVLDGKTGMIALFGKPRTFPLESADRNGWEVSKDEFFSLFPETKVFFEYNEALDDSILKHDTSSEPRMLTPSEISWLKQNKKAAIEKIKMIIAVRDKS